MKNVVLAAGVLLAAAGVPAYAQGAGEGQSAEELKEEKKICRTQRMTGSLTRSTRVCMTEAQWRELHSRTRQGLDEMNRNAAGGTSVQNNPGAGG